MIRIYSRDVLFDLSNEFDGEEWVSGHKDVDVYLQLVYRVECKSVIYFEENDVIRQECHITCMLPEFFQIVNEGHNKLPQERLTVRGFPITRYRNRS